MELIVLGAAPAYTDRAGSAASSYLLLAGDAGGASGAGRSGRAALLLDLGQGAFANLASTLEPSTLTAPWMRRSSTLPIALTSPE